MEKIFGAPILWLDLGGIPLAPILFGFLLTLIFKRWWTFLVAAGVATAMAFFLISESVRLMVLPFLSTISALGALFGSLIGILVRGALGDIFRKE